MLQENVTTNIVFGGPIGGTASKSQFISNGYSGLQRTILFISMQIECLFLKKSIKKEVVNVQDVSNRDRIEIKRKRQGTGINNKFL